MLRASRPDGRYGVEKWLVFHDAQQSPIAHLVTDGELPDEFNSIRDTKLRIMQSDDGDDS